MDAHIIYAELKTHADAPTHANKDMHTDVLSTWRSFSNGVFKSVPGYHGPQLISCSEIKADR